MSFTDQQLIDAGRAYMAAACSSNLGAAVAAMRAALPAPAAPASLARWYCITRDGRATLCVDQQDAQEVAAQEDINHPSNGPHRAVLLAEVATS